MASNDGSRLTVFGLTFRQFDSRHMQQILRQYSQLPSNPGNRADLFTALFDLASTLDDDEASGIEGWMRDGGDPDLFPAPRSFTPSAPGTSGATDEHWGQVWPQDEYEAGSQDEVEHHDEAEYQDEAEFQDEAEDQGHWQEYNPADFQDLAEADGWGAVTDDEGNGWGNVGEEEIAAAFPAAGFQDGIDPEHEGQEPQEFDAGEAWATDNVPERSELECYICAEVYASDDLLAPAKLTSTCDHDSGNRACFSCVGESIHAAIERLAINAINCPFCNDTLSEEEIKQYAKPEDFTRYEYLSYIQKEDTLMCLAPGCGHRQTYVGNTIDGTDAQMTCDICAFVICVRHNTPWHHGQTCEEFDCDDAQIERLEQAEATAKLLTNDQSKICPSCKQGVTKQDGCDHLTCICGGTWCFVCLADYSNILRNGESGHAPHCDYHPQKRMKTKAEHEARHAQLIEQVLGKPASEALLKARAAKNERIRADIRPRALEAAEARIKAEKERVKQERLNSTESQKKKTKLVPAWQET